MYPPYDAVADTHAKPKCSLAQVDPRTTESVRGASRLMTEKEAKMAKEYQALKERNQFMEAQLESMR